MEPNTEIDLSAGLKKCRKGQVRDKSTKRCRTDYRKSQRSPRQMRRSRNMGKMARLGVTRYPRTTRTKSICSYKRTKRACEAAPFCQYLKGSKGKRGSCRSNPRRGSDKSVDRYIANIFAGGQTTDE